MATSRVKTNLFLTFEIAAKWQYVCYAQRSYGLISLNQPKTTSKVIVDPDPEIKTVGNDFNNKPQDMLTTPYKNEN